jgi:hypothetical protein
MEQRIEDGIFKSLDTWWLVQVDAVEREEIFCLNWDHASPK